MTNEEASVTDYVLTVAHQPVSTYPACVSACPFNQVAIHPGDRGMAAIAEAIWNALHMGQDQRRRKDTRCQ